MTDLFVRTTEYINENELLKNGDKVLLAVSGGADSMCMLSLLMKYCDEHDICLGVVHVNHGFRKEAYEEADYVRRYCGERNIPFFLKEIGEGNCDATEEAARLFRYQLIEEVADTEKYDYIALAHNANDRAETLLFNMFRGTGLTGLTSIRSRRDRFIRPILCLTREEIEEYVHNCGIAFYTDATNLEDDYSRNKIRHHIIPISQEINEGSIKHMNAVADYMDALNEYIKKQTDRAYELCVSKNNVFYSVDVGLFIEQDKVIAPEILRKCILSMTPHLKDITAEHISSINKLFYRADNAEIHLPYGIKAYREYDKVIITDKGTGNEIEEIEIDASMQTQTIELADGNKLVYRLIDAYSLDRDIMESIPRNKYTKWFDYDTINSAIFVRGRQDGDYLLINNKGERKSLGRLMIEAKIPPRSRDIQPVVAAGNEILWVIGYRDGFSHRVSEQTKNILEIKVEE